MVLDAGCCCARGSDGSCGEEVVCNSSGKRGKEPTFSGVDGDTDACVAGGRAAGVETADSEFPGGGAMGEEMEDPAVDRVAGAEATGPEAADARGGVATGPTAAARPACGTAGSLASALSSGQASGPALLMLARMPWGLIRVLRSPADETEMGEAAYAFGKSVSLNQIAATVRVSAA